MERGAHGVGRQGCLLWTAILQCFILLMIACFTASTDITCNCSATVDFERFASSPTTEACCLNFTGSSIGHLQWNIFSKVDGLLVLDLSHCNLSDIHNAVSTPALLAVLHLNHNQLERLPQGFLENAPGLRIVHLEGNRLIELPGSFLKTSDAIRELYLDCNHLSSVPPSIFKPSLTQLGLTNNSLDCSCSFYNDLEIFLHGNASSHMFDHAVCHTPQHLHGRNLSEVQKSDVCKSHGLTALFICLPLMLILGVAVCYFCCCKQRKSGFDVTKECQLATIDRNGSRNLTERHQYVPCEVTIPSENEKNVLLKNQVLLKPSVALLGSNRDLYEQVEVQIGASVETLAGSREIFQKMPSTSGEEEEMGEPRAGNYVEEETVSVSDVLQDSTDREKLYMSQSADYYNLVPGIDLDDSDHFEYENVNLS